MMKYAACQVSVAPLRSEARDSSEMVSQLLFGERLKVLEVHEKWLKVQLLFDDYIGWIDPKQVVEVTEEDYTNITTEKYLVKPFNYVLENGLHITLTIGAEISTLHENKIKIGNKYLEYFGSYTSGKKSKDQLMHIAKAYLNVPYIWGGKSSFGIDCSGLTQQVYKIAGYKIPRDAYKQAEIGEILNFIEEAEPGDLAFFDNEEGKIIHVGIVCNERKILHAHGKVRIDNIDEYGIFNNEIQKYSHKLRYIRKII